MAIWNIIHPFGIIYGNLVILVYFSPALMVYCTKKKLATQAIGTQLAWVQRSILSRSWPYVNKLLKIGVRLTCLHKSKVSKKYLHKIDLIKFPNSLLHTMGKDWQQKNVM
jgi:hypothetical protein